jgi:TRAP transporter TAXI family solute receptor
MEMKRNSMLAWVILSTIILVFTSSVSIAGSNPDFKYFKIEGSVAGSSWYTWAVNMGLELEKKFPGLKCSGLEGGASKSLVNVNNDYTTAAATFMVSMVDAWYGTGPAFKGKTFRNVRYVGTLTKQWLNVIVRKGVNIEDGQFTRDLPKYRFSPGERNWSTIGVSLDGLRGLGITEEVIKKAGGKIHFIGYGDMKTMMQDRNLDVAIVWQTMPSMIFQELAHARPGVYMPQLTKEELEKFVSGQEKNKKGIFFEGKIPDNYLEGGRSGGPTIGFSAPIIVHKDLPDEFVYQFTKICFESEKVKSSAGSVKYFLTAEDPELGKPKFLPWHPGALKYWKDRGLVK